MIFYRILLPKTLNNSGISFIGDEAALDALEKTLIVVGIARGGTSAVAGALHHLGVFMGSLSSEPVFEDLHLATPFEKGAYSRAEEVVANYNQKYSIWGFKRPAVIDYLERINSTVRNPIYLFIFKDIFSVSNRNNISMRLDIVKGLDRALSDYQKMIKFLNENQVNGFLFSYEKIMSNKEKFIDALSLVVGKDNITNEQYSAALAFIEPNPAAYINQSRITRSVGKVGLIEANRVMGWGKLAYSDEPVFVELYVNDELINSQLANHFRANVLNSKMHGTGYCGFAFGLMDRPLQKGDKVAVKVKEDVLFLEGSNVFFSTDKEDQSV